jgi:phosphoribosyl 1,2-cyclic phosphate phosphodiesterase
MKVTFLGTGTSVGVPVIGCDCAVCRSDDPRDKRWRPSIYVEAGDQRILVDTSTDLRAQALRFRMPAVDAILFTHSHADHIFGFDDIRRYNTIQNCAIPVYASAETLADLQRIFDYVNTKHVPGVFRPKTEYHEVAGAFEVGSVQIDAIPVDHDPKPTCGYRFEAEGKTLGYFPDCRGMSDEAIAQLEGINVMILDALRRTPHRTHFSLDESVALLNRIGAAESFIVHMCHDLGHEETERSLPAGIAVSYDGLVLEW